MGENRTARDLQNITATIQEIRESDLRINRPIYGNVSADWPALNPNLDILSVGQQPVGTSFIASQYGEWIRERTQFAGASNIPWADVQTEFATDMQRQVRAIAGTVPPVPLSPQQIMYLATDAVRSGARGIRFLSKTRLDGRDPATRLRGSTLQFVLGELSQYEPWVAGGAVRGEVEAEQANLRVTALETSQGRLLLIQRPTHREQYWAGDAALTTISFRDVAAPRSDQAYQITPAGLKPLAVERDPAGVRVTIEDCPYSTALFFTQNPMVVRRLNSMYEYRPGEETHLHSFANLARQWIAIMQLVEEQMNRMGRSTPAASGALNEAVNAMRQASRLQLGRADSVGLKFVERTFERLAFVQREFMTEPLGEFPSKTSSPLLTHFSLVPLHWQLANHLRNANWKPNGLAGGDFEDLSHMTKNGWINRRVDHPGLATQVELSRDAAAQGDYGLQLQVTSSGLSYPRCFVAATMGNVWPSRCSGGTTGSNPRLG